MRDKVAASRRKGMWMGGTVPLGYRAENRKLIIDEVEAETVRTIFGLYRALGSTTALLTELRHRGITTAVRVSRTGRSVGGIPFGPGPIDYLLHNRVYVGEVEHRGEVYPGEHQPIIDRATFEAVQERLAANANRKRLRARTQAILTGRIFDSRGNRMAPTHASKGGVRYHYYVTRAIAEGRPREAGVVRRVPAREIERIVLETIGSHCGGAGISPLHASLVDHGTASTLTTVQRHLRRIEVHGDHLRISLVGRGPAGGDRAPVASPATDRSTAGSNHGDPITLTVPWMPPALRPSREVRLAAEPKPDPRQSQLFAQIAIGRRWLQELTEGASPGVEAIAKREGKHPRSIRSALSFALLAPEIVERIIDGLPLPDHLTLTAIGRGLPSLWSEQRRLFGMAQAAAGR